MAIAIEPETVFPKVSTPAGRNDRDALSGESGKGFARALLQATEAPSETVGPTEASSATPPPGFFDAPEPEVPDAASFAEAVEVPVVRIEGDTGEARAEPAESTTEDPQEPDPETIIVVAAPPPASPAPAPDVPETDLKEMAPAAMETPKAA